MQGYDAKDLARSFRTVRANTIQIAEEIPEEQYGFRPAPGTRSVAETLAHLVTATAWPQDFHSRRLPATEFAFFRTAMEKAAAEAAQLTTKAKLVEVLRRRGEEFAAWMEKLGDDVLAERVQYPAGMQPPDKTRFEMLLAAKEHEMHHRAQLMTVERMLRITPHLTRQMEARVAEMQKGATS